MIDIRAVICALDLGGEMIRRSFRRGLRLGILGGVGYAVWRVIQSRGDNHDQASDAFTPPVPMRPTSAGPASGPRVTPLRSTAPAWTPASTSAPARPPAPTQASAPAPAPAPAPPAPAPRAPAPARTAPSDPAPAPKAPVAKKAPGKKAAAKKAPAGAAAKSRKSTTKKPRPPS